MARLDRIDRQHLPLHHEIVKKVFEGIEPSVDGRRGQLGRVLLLDEVFKVAPGHRTQCLGERREKPAQIPPIILDGVRRIVARVQVRTEEIYFYRFHVYLPLVACRWAIFVIACSYWCRLVAS
jgi:hypothetical protein